MQLLPSCFYLQTFSSQTEISQLTGEHIARGAADIIPDASEILTLKCESCGAEVVIDTASALQARCHWCRNTLSLNSQVPNGAVPDALLPFKITKEEARQEIKKFVSLRKFFANRRFKKNLTSITFMVFIYLI
ncbi:hypothetical protein [Arcanobacterium hippocoleae]|uniref:hypothetical protein n=1 Tax=Arcanobacterium hippocoleae TaxID=149017 RepID=UPI00333FD6B4